MGGSEELTSLSGAPPPKIVNGAEFKAAAPQKKGIDYSKFDKIEDSDDEKPQTAQTDAAKAKAPAEKPHCHNCHKDISKPLRCGICKKVEYCSTACQKDDWRFHKRTCKKPEEPKEKKEEPTERKQAAGEKKKQPAEEEKVVEEDEKLDWYRHREWKPANEPKKEFRPTQITAEEAKTQVAAAQEKLAAGSAWNAAGTWEDKDVTAHAHKTLKETLEALANVDTAGGSLAAVEIAEMEGDASKPVIRGIQRHMFDLSFQVKFVFKWMGSEGQKQAEGHVQVRDFTDNTFAPSAQSAPVLELSFRGESLEPARRQAVEAAVGAEAWPPKPQTLMGHAAARMEAWSKEYTQAS